MELETDLTSTLVSLYVRVKETTAHDSIKVWVDGRKKLLESRKFRGGCRILARAKYLGTFGHMPHDLNLNPEK